MVIIGTLRIAGQQPPVSRFIETMDDLQGYLQEAVLPVETLGHSRDGRICLTNSNRGLSLRFLVRRLNSSRSWQLYGIYSDFYIRVTWLHSKHKL